MITKEEKSFIRQALFFQGDKLDKKIGTFMWISIVITILICFFI